MLAIKDFERTLKSVFYGKNYDYDQQESGRKSQEANAKKERKKKNGKPEENQPEENQPEENQPEEKE